jgi:SAM-dependent methyltransferase
MLTRDLLAFVRSSLPDPPSRILEIGAGRGELAEELRAAGYAVTAIDPAAEPDTGVQPVALLDAEGTFDAAIAVTSLHHVDPLEESCAHLAGLISPGGPLVIDEFDVDRYDERAAGWWLNQREASGTPHEHSDPSRMVTDLRHHVHPLATVCAALRPYFELGEPIRGAYLHRWELRASLRAPEVELIAEGRLPATGARLVALRKA